MPWRQFSLGPVLLGFIFACCFLAGCGEKPDQQQRKRTDSDMNGGKPKAQADVPLTELASKGWGKITGRIAFDGTPPTPTVIPEILSHPDKNVCLAGTMMEKQHQTWIVGADGGVANVLISLEPPANTYFQIKEELKKPANFKLRQPHCAFIPRVVALFPKYNAKEGLRPTGQKLEVINDSPILHNFRFLNKSVNLPPGKSDVFDFNPSDKPVGASCSMHGWMRAWIWAFDHPYFAVTKDDGIFEVEVPAGVELAVMGWHAARPNWGTLKKISIKNGETLDLGSIPLK